ncbi:ArgS-related anticodon-binding protein NrtL [Streptomyces sp. NPDC046203]|uniref:ArgS-related anticodon-binding protein NrtL n=1 Tax=Streptomyces sp. NPDC046203 TaxID=3154602 RepID=UPI0033F4AFD5
MTPADLSLTVLHAVRRAVDEGVLRVEVPPRVKVERPRPGGVGDYASSVALGLARPAGRDARDVAAILKDRLREAPGIRAVDITGPGFLNFTLDAGDGNGVLREIARTGLAYGHSTALAGTRVRFLASPEPRAALLAETSAALLRAQGADADADIDAGASDDAERISALPAPYEPHLLGVDAARWALLRPAAHDRALPGAPLLVQHERNALFRVRYAHSRARALVRNAAQLGFAPSYETADADAYAGAPAHTHARAHASAPEAAPTPAHAPAPEQPPAPAPTPAHAPTAACTSPLPTLLGDHPAVLLLAARHRAPDRLARHLEAVADALLAYQHTVLPLGDEKPSAAHRSRLALAEAAGTVLAGGLSLLGISAPDQI